MRFCWFIFRYIAVCRKNHKSLAQPGRTQSSLKDRPSLLSVTVQVTSYGLWATSYELRGKICDTQNPACSGWWQYGTVPGHKIIVRCRIVLYIDRIQLSQLICMGWWLYWCCTIRLSAQWKLDFRGHCMEAVICRILWAQLASSIQLLLICWNQFYAFLMMVSL